MTFSANGDYLLTGEDTGVRAWRVKDGKQMATMEEDLVRCLAVSRDGRWIAAGTGWGNMFVSDTKTFKKVFQLQDCVIANYNPDHGINGVDFSPDSTRLVSAANDTSIWDIATGEEVQTLDHGDSAVRAAKYSPLGDRIATATPDSVRVWDSNDGRLLVDIKVTVTPWYNTGLLWSNNDLFVISDSKIKQFEASTGSAVSEWPVPSSIRFSCIVLPKHGEFIAYSIRRIVTLWDTATQTQLGLIQHHRDIHSVALSPDDRFLAIGGEDGEIALNSLSRITVSVLSRGDAHEQLSYSVHVSIGFNPFVSSTPHIPGYGKGVVG